MPHYVARRLRLSILLTVASILLSAFILCVDRNHDENPIILSEDGGWCWFEGPRAIVSGEMLYVGTVASGLHDPRRRGDIELLSHNLRTGLTDKLELHNQFEADDHNSPALVETTEGRILAVYAKHGTEGKFYSRASGRDGSSFWGPVNLFWEKSGSRITYSNLFRLENENNRIYNFFRGLYASNKPSYVYSDDQGLTWLPGNIVINSPASRPYVCYASNGIDSIHFVYTEGHPRDSNNSLYHVAYRQGLLHESDWKPVCKLVDGLRHPEDGTLIYRGGEGQVAWPCDVEIGNEGPRVTYSVRSKATDLSSSASNRDHNEALFYRYASFYDGRWVDYQMAVAGTCLYDSEGDYTGLSCLDPDLPGVTYISTNANPITGMPLISRADNKRHYEIFKGMTEDRGATWTWLPITQDSSSDNLRPLIPKRSGGGTMLLWLRGTYRSYTDYDLAVLGLKLPSL